MKKIKTGPQAKLSTAVIISLTVIAFLHNFFLKKRHNISKEVEKVK